MRNYQELITDQKNELNRLKMDLPRITENANAGGSMWNHILSKTNKRISELEKSLKIFGTL